MLQKSFSVTKFKNIARNGASPQQQWRDSLAMR
jgi:hypothetical protein